MTILMTLLPPPPGMSCMVSASVRSPNPSLAMQPPAEMSCCLCRNPSTVLVLQGFDSFFLLKKIIEVQLIYSVMLVAGVQPSDSDIYIYTDILFFRFFSMKDYQKIVSIVPCPVQWVLVYFLFSSIYLLILNSLFIPPTPYLLETVSFLSMSVGFW